jgi:UDP-N-acetylmuramate--alanine ligase
VYSDYAHRPTGISATLRSAKEMTEGRVFCVFQPHTYSRLKAFFEQTAEALSIADRVMTVKVYAAREVDTLGVSSELLADAVGNGAKFFPEYSDAIAGLAEEVREGDTVIIMGAGSIVNMLELIPFDSDEN